MKKKINVTVIASALMLVFSAVVWFAIPYGIAEAKSATDIGPRAFPQLVCGAMAVLSALQLVLVLTHVQKGKQIAFDFSTQVPVLIAMALAVIAVICAKFVNLLIAGMVCAECFLLLLRAKDWRYYFAVVVAGGILFALMKYIMHIRF